jgi:glycosyltransferase involved in cell wall biosynthesis
VLLLARDLKLQGVDCLTQIAGEGPLRPELESLAIQYGITDRMRFLGYRSDIADLIAKARLVVHSSDGEGSPNAIMEALACGRPVVATNVGDVARLIRDGKNGYIVPRDDSDALLKRVSEILSDDEIARRMGESALEYARQDFALPEFVHKTFEAYRSAGWKFLK